MKNGTKSPDDKKRKTKKRKEAKDHAPMAKAQLSEVKTVSEAKPVMRVQAAAPMPAPKPKPKPVAAAKPVKAAPAPKHAPAPKPAPVTKAPAKPALKAVPKVEPKVEAKVESKSNGKAKKDVKTEAKKASKSATPEAAFEMAPLMSAFKPPFAMPSFAIPQVMMPPSLAEAGQDALAVNRKLVEMTQANMRSGLDFAMRLATVKTPMELVSLQMSYWQERMGTFARQAEELRTLARGSRR
jgi:hypothetical protein